jgi:hypothetical protein
MDEQRQEEEQPRRRSFNWIGLIAFVVIVFGRRIAGFVQWLFSGGVALLPGNFDLALILGGGALLAVVVAVLVTLRASRRDNAPMPPFGGPSLPSAPGRAPTFASPPRPATSVPSAPRFEPIITPKVVVASALLTLLAGGAIALFLLVQP